MTEGAQVKSTDTKTNLMLGVLAAVSIWQVMIGIIALTIYWIGIRRGKLRSSVFFMIGVTLLLFSAWLHSFKPEFYFSICEYFKAGLKLHYLFWQDYFYVGPVHAFYVTLQNQFNQILALIFIATGCLGFIEKYFRNPHEAAFMELQQKKTSGKEKIPEKVINKLLAELKDEQYAGTALGISLLTGESVIVPDQAVNEIVLVLGTTGGGKTITLRRFYRRAILAKSPLIVVDGKPSPKNVAWLEDLAKQYNKPFFGFNCGNYASYNALSDGGYTELKDKIICLKDEWSSDYCQSIAEDYLQTALNLLLRIGEPFDLRRVGLFRL